MHGEPSQSFGVVMKPGVHPHMGLIAIAGLALPLFAHEHACLRVSEGGIMALVQLNTLQMDAYLRDSKPAPSDLEGPFVGSGHCASKDA